VLVDGSLFLWICSGCGEKEKKKRVGWNEGVLENFYCICSMLFNLCLSVNLLQLLLQEERISDGEKQHNCCNCNSYVATQLLHL